MMWRIATSPLLNSTILEVKHEWTLEDVFEAHAALNTIKQMAEVPKTQDAA